MSVTCGPRPTARHKRAGPQRTRLRRRVQQAGLERCQEDPADGRSVAETVGRGVAVTPARARALLAAARTVPTGRPAPCHPFAMPAQDGHAPQAHPAGKAPSRRADLPHRPRRPVHTPTARRPTTMEGAHPGTHGTPGHRPSHRANAIPRSQIKISNTGRGRRRPATWPG